MKKICLLLCLVSLAFAVATLLAQPELEADGPPPRLPDELKLTKEQKQEIKELRVKLQKELVPLRSKLQIARLDLQTEIDAEKPNRATINSLIDETAKIRAEMAKLNISHRLTVAQLLTPEQRELLQEFKGKRPPEAKGERRHGMKRGRGFCPQME